MLDQHVKKLQDRRRRLLKLLNMDSNELVITSLSQIAYLRSRINELEAENAKLSLQVSKCRCNENLGCTQIPIVSDQIVDSKRVMKLNGDQCRLDQLTTTQIEWDMMKKHSPRRYVALKVMYLGQRFYGFASQAQMNPTIESEIFKALKKTKLLVGGKKETCYSRCGRTDKGVSAIGQVIALFLRSKLKSFDSSNLNFGKVTTEEEGDKEIDYVKILNRVLPKDVRIIGWCPIPSTFNARFSCKSREYKYYFWSDNLNVSVMDSAGKKFLGDHDFSNFCKMDAVNVHNYRRHIASFQVSPCDSRFDGDQLHAIKIRGSAFLWHQVRCMVSVLFMIGQGLETPDVIEALLDTSTITRKPQYLVAPEIPLVLLSCEFDNLQFMCSSVAAEALQVHLEKEHRACQLQATIYHEALLSCSYLLTDTRTTRDSPKNKVSHVPLMSRPIEPSYEERRARLEGKKTKAS